LNDFLIIGPWGDILLEPSEIVDQLKFKKPGMPLRPDMAGLRAAPPIVKGMHIFMIKGQRRAVLRVLEKSNFGCKKFLVSNLSRQNVVRKIKE
jgi:hypothetical protein